MILYEILSTVARRWQSPDGHAMRWRGHPDALIHRIVYENQAEFLGSSPKFQLPETRLALAGAIS